MGGGDGGGAPVTVDGCPVASARVPERRLVHFGRARHLQLERDPPSPLQLDAEIGTQPISHRALEATRSARAHGEQLRLPILCFACCT